MNHRDDDTTITLRWGHTLRDFRVSPYVKRTVLHEYRRNVERHKRYTFLTGGARDEAAAMLLALSASLSGGIELVAERDASPESSAFAA